MAPYGGFDHNAQALRIVTRLERHYADFDGLNLTWETLEGIAKHNGPVTDPPGTPLKGDALPYALAECNAGFDLDLSGYASAEAQVAAVADDIAYNHHDLHDGLRSGLFTEDDLMELPITGPALAEVDRLYPGAGGHAPPPRSAAPGLRRHGRGCAAGGRHTAWDRPDLHSGAGYPRSEPDHHPVFRPLFRELKVIRHFLFTRMYRAPSVVEMRARVTKMVEELFPLFMAQPELAACRMAVGRGAGAG